MSAETLAHWRSLDDNPLAEHIAHGRLLTTSGRDLVAHPLSSYLAWGGDRGWLQWNGKVWEAKSEPDAVEIVRRELRSIYTSLAALVESAEDVRKIATLLSATKAKNVAYFLRGLLAVASDSFDREADLINMANGVVNLRTGKLTKHDPLLYFTKITDVEYHPDATHPDWDAALSAIEDDETREWVQVRYGQAITGHPADDARVLIQQGGGSNGKSNLVDAIVGALGDFATVVSEKVLLANPSDHPAELMPLRGARLAVIEETPEGKHLPTKRLKDLLGTKRLTARAMRQDPVTWEASHSLVLNSNYLPVVSEVDFGTWRRLKALVKFKRKYVSPDTPILGPGEVHGDPDLSKRLAGHSQRVAIMAWLIEGARYWYKNPLETLPVPLLVEADWMEWRESADLILGYSRERLVFDPDASVLSTELYEDFTEWLRSSGRHPWNNQTFADRFGEHEQSKHHRVEKKRATVPVGVSRRYDSSLSPAVPSKATMWTGVRFA